MRPQPQRRRRCCCLPGPAPSRRELLLSPQLAVERDVTLVAAAAIDAVRLLSGGGHPADNGTDCGWTARTPSESTSAGRRSSPASSRGTGRSSGATSGPRRRTRRTGSWRRSTRRSRRCVRTTASARSASGSRRRSTRSAAASSSRRTSRSPTSTCATACRSASASRSGSTTTRTRPRSASGRPARRAARPTCVMLTLGTGVGGGVIAGGAPFRGGGGAGVELGHVVVIAGRAAVPGHVHRPRPSRGAWRRARAASEAAPRGVRPGRRRSPARTARERGRRDGEGDPRADRRLPRHRAWARSRTSSTRS